MNTIARRHSAPSDHVLTTMAAIADGLERLAQRKSSRCKLCATCETPIDWHVEHCESTH
jgi:hypothetical protein